MLLCEKCINRSSFPDKNLCQFLSEYDGDLCQYFDDKSKHRKWNKGKLKYSLVLPEFLELMADILTRGEINHPKEPDGTPSWQLVDPIDYENALFRHLQARRKGEKTDPDPNMPTSHFGNIAVNAMFLWWFDQQGER